MDTTSALYSLYLMLKDLYEAGDTSEAIVNVLLEIERIIS